MFQFPSFPPGSYGFTDRYWLFRPVGFPIRKSPTIASAHDSSRLIAVYRVLLRRLSPRHPPYALSSLTKTPYYQVIALLDPDLLCTRMQLSKT